ncbi:MAG: MATE family efflux transporter [Oscillospiraceae bacterium]
MKEPSSSSLLTGSVWKSLLRFALPFLAATFLQFLYGAVDLFVVGKFTDAAGVAAVATGSQIMQTVTGLLLGLTTGGTVLIGQYVGAKRPQDVSRTIGTMFSVFALLAVGLTAVMLLCTDLMIAAMHVPEAAVLPAKQYLFTCGCGLIFIAGYNTVSGMLRGLGDSRSPMIFIAIACCINVVGDFILVGGFGMGALGAAIATVAAQGISFLLSVLVLRRSSFPFDFQPSSFRMEKEKVRGLFRMGSPLAVQNVLVNLSFLLITAIVNNIGLTQSAAAGIVERLTGFSMLAPMAFSSAISAMSAQNVGANQIDRAKRVMWTGMGFSLLFGTVMFALAQLFPEGAVGLMIDDPAVMAQGALYIRSYSFDCILVCLVFCFNGFFAGCGRTGFTMANCLLVTFLVRVPVVFFMSLLPGVTLFQIGLAAPLASALQIILQLVYLKAGAWRKGAPALSHEHI